MGLSPSAARLHGTSHSVWRVPGFKEETVLFPPVCANTSIHLRLVRGLREGHGGHELPGDELIDAGAQRATGSYSPTENAEWCDTSPRGTG